MSSADAQMVYNRSHAAGRVGGVEHGFAQQYDLTNPEAAMSSYQRLMHQHTQQQFDMAARRRSSTGTSSGPPSLSPQSSDASSTGSMSS